MLRLQDTPDTCGYQLSTIREDTSISPQGTHGARLPGDVGSSPSPIHALGTQGSAAAGRPIGSRQAVGVQLVHPPTAITTTDGTAGGMGEGEGEGGAWPDGAEQDEDEQELGIMLTGADEAVGASTSKEISVTREDRLARMSHRRAQGQSVGSDRSSGDADNLQCAANSRSSMTSTRISLHGNDGVDPLAKNAPDNRRFPR